MLVRVIGLLIGAVLLSGVAYLYFGIDLVAIFTLFVLVVKKALPAIILFGRKWLASFFLEYAPKKVILFLVRKGVIDRKAEQRLIVYFQLERTRLGNYAKRKFSWFYARSFVVRLFLLTIVMGTILTLSILTTGWWFVLIWLPREIGLLLKPLWSPISEMLSNTIAVRGLQWCSKKLGQTKLGYLFSRSNNWLEKNVTTPIEQKSVTQRKRWFPALHKAIRRLPSTRIVLPKAVRHKPSRNPFSDGHICGYYSDIPKTYRPKNRPRPRR